MVSRTEIEFEEYLMKEKQRKFKETIFKASKALGLLKPPKIKIWDGECPHGKVNELAHIHPDEGIICVSTRRLKQMTIEDIEEAATHEVSHMLDITHDYSFKKIHGDVKIKTWKPKGVVVEDGSKERVKKSKDKIKEDKIRCNYHLCRKKTKLRKCPYCGGYFCKKHFSPKLPLTYQMVDSERNPTLARLYEEEWRKVGGHPDAVYSEYKLNEIARKEKELTAKIMEALDKMKRIEAVEPKIEVNVFSKLPKPKFSSKESKCYRCEAESKLFKCKYCGHHFCGIHSDPEDHACVEYREGLEKSKHAKKEFEKYKDFLRKEREKMKYEKVPLSEGEASYYERYTPIKKIKSGRIPIKTIIIIIILIIGLLHIYNNLDVIKNYINNFLNPEVPMSTGPSTYVIPEVTKTPEPPKPPNVNIDDLETQVYSLVNKERIKYGLDPLSWSDEIALAARRHSKDMAENNFFEHVNPQGKDVGDRLKDVGVYDWNMVGENINKISIVDYYLKENGIIVSTVYLTPTKMAEKAVEEWMSSSGHRENILKSEFDKTGIGIAVDSDGITYYMTQNFVRKVTCGYKGGSCCPSPPGYLPSCYVPYDCIGGICQ